jgi:hypothetical protein
MRRSGALLWATCALSMTGCLERPGAAIGPEIGFGQNVSIGGGGASAVDVLFVVDNSGSMADEQRNLALRIPELVEDLADPPDLNGDGMRDWSPVETLRIGIVTTDVGTGTRRYCPGVGDDGELMGGVFEITAGQDPAAIVEGVREAVTSLGTGCGYEQQLEAAARAMSHADEIGFPADDNLLAVILVSDEEDCSVVDDDTFFDNEIPDPLLNVHCTRNADELTPVEDLIAQIRGDRTSENFVFATITGLPDGIAEGAQASTILAHPEMQYIEQTDEDGGYALRETCEFHVPCEAGTANCEGGMLSLGGAAPARRLVEAAALVPDAIMTTICTDDFGPAIREITERIGQRVEGVCLARGVPDDGAGVPCSATVRLPAGMTCDSLDIPLLGTANGRERCEVPQVASGSTAVGFFYDAAAEGCPQLALTRELPIGSQLDAECFFPVYVPLGEQCARSSQCETGYCDAVTNLCAPALGIAT